MKQETQYQRRCKAGHAARRAARHLPAALPGAFLMTDPARLQDPHTLISGLPRGWGVIYRHFGNADHLTQARKLAQLCRRRGLCFLVGGDPRLARKVHADGVHWPERMARDARRWRGRFSIMTMSAHSISHLHFLARNGVHALILSTVFPSRSPSARRPIGALRLRRAARVSRVKLYALGGVNPSNAASVCDFAGLAAIEGWECFRPRTEQRAPVN